MARPYQQRQDCGIDTVGVDENDPRRCDTRLSSAVDALRLVTGDNKAKRLKCLREGLTVLVVRPQE